RASAHRNRDRLLGLQVDVSVARAGGEQHRASYGRRCNCPDRADHYQLRGLRGSASMRDRASGPAKGELDLIHPSLTKPVLWAGVERRIVGIEFMIVVLVVTWRGMTPTALLLISCIVIPMHLVA